MRKLKYIAACLMFAVLAVACHAQSTDSSDSAEYLIKAGFTYNFAKLMQWPGNAFPKADSPIVIGVLGVDPFGGTLDDVLAGKKVDNRSFEVKHLKWGNDLRDCNILFVSSSEAAAFRRDFPCYSRDCRY